VHFEHECAVRPYPRWTVPVPAAATAGGTTGAARPAKASTIGGEHPVLESRDVILVGRKMNARPDGAVVFPPYPLPRRDGGPRGGPPPRPAAQRAAAQRKCRSGRGPHPALLGSAGRRVHKRSRGKDTRIARTRPVAGRRATSSDVDRPRTGVYAEAAESMPCWQRTLKSRMTIIDGEAGQSSLRGDTKSPDEPKIRASHPVHPVHPC